MVWQLSIWSWVNLFPESHLTESQNPFGWERHLRSLSPAINLNLLGPSLNHGSYLLQPCTGGRCLPMKYDSSFTHLFHCPFLSKTPVLTKNLNRTKPTKRQKMLFLDMFFTLLILGRSGWGGVRCQFTSMRRLQLLQWDKKEQQKLVAH